MKNLTLYSEKHKRFFLLYAIVFFNFFSIATLSQDIDYEFARLSIRDGLSHNSVYSIIQDNYGYLWFGTQDGLNRYDGYNIKIFRSSVENKKSLSSSNFGKILVDKSGYYWFGTFGGGIDRYDPRTNTFKNFSYNPYDTTSISNNQVIFMYEDSRGNVWIGTPDGGLNMYNPENDNFTRYSYNQNDSNSLNGNRAKCMVETPDGTLWVGTENGLNRMDIEKGTFIHYTHNPNNDNSLSGNTIQNMVANADGSIWIAIHGGGLNHFDVASNTITRYMHNPNDKWSISDNKADCILKDSYGMLWIGTYEGGLNKFDPKNGRFFHFKNDPNNPFSISSNRIEYLFEDSSNILWIGTRGGGLSKLDLKPRKFYNIRHNPNNDQTLSQHNIMAISSDSKGNVWIGTDGGGLTIYNPQQNTFEHLSHNPKNSNSLSNNRVWAVFVDSEDVVWAGTYQGGLNRVEKVGNAYYFTHFKHVPFDTLSISNNHINCIFKDRDENLWVGTAGGLNRMYGGDGKNKHFFKVYRHSPFNFTFKTTDNYVNSIIQDQHGNLWVGSYQSGLYKFDVKNNEFTHFLPAVDDVSSFLRTLNILGVFVDSKDNIWIGTESRGLLKVNPKDRLIEEHPFNEALKNKMIIGLIDDNQGNLWIVSTGELYKHSSTENTLISFSYDDGIEVDGFNRNSFHKDAMGQLYFGGNAALSYFRPSEVYKNPNVPKVSITDFRILTNTIWSDVLVPLEYTVHSSKGIQLSYKDYFFSIEFASFDFTNPSKNNFQYKLEGFDKEWVTMGTNNTAVFTNLNPGKYIFKIKGSNNDNVWNKVPIELEINISPPFWKRTWFILMQSLILLLIVLAYIRYRTYRLRVDKYKLEHKVKERTNELNAKNEQLKSALARLKNAQIQLIQTEKMASIGVLTAGLSHEINNPLNYIHGSITVLEKYVNENLSSSLKDLNPLIDIINEGVVRVTKIIQALDQFSRTTDLYTNNCDIHNIIDNCLFMLKQKLADRVEVKKSYSKALPLIRGNDGRLHQLFFNIIMNAQESIRGDGSISITSSYSDDKVTIEIADTGRGISKKNISRITEPFFTTKDPGEGIGLGLSIVYAIVKEHKGSINIDSEEGVGTKVILTIPVNCE